MAHFKSTFNILDSIPDSFIQIHFSPPLLKPKFNSSNLRCSTDSSIMDFKTNKSVKLAT